LSVRGTINRYDGLPLDQEYIIEGFENG